MDDPNLLWLPTDAALQLSPEFKKYVMLYASDNNIFLRDYALAHKKMSEIGALFENGVRLSLKDDSGS